MHSHVQQEQNLHMCSILFIQVGLVFLMSQAVWWEIIIISRCWVHLVLKSWCGPWYLNDLQSQLVHQTTAAQSSRAALRDTGGESVLCSMCGALLLSAGWFVNSQNKCCTFLLQGYFLCLVSLFVLYCRKKTKTHLYPFTRIRKQQTSANISLLSSLSLCILCIQSCIGWLCSHKCLSAPALTGCDENNSPHYTWISLSLGQIQPNRIETDYSDPVLVYWWWWFRSKCFCFFCG